MAVGTRHEEKNGSGAPIGNPAERKKALNKWKEKGEIMDSRPAKLFFDIDDVLFPSTEFAARARRNALNAMIGLGLDMPYERMESALGKVVRERGSNYPKHFDVLLEKLDVGRGARAKFVAAAVGAYHDTKAAIEPYADVPLALLNLREKYPLYVASDGIAVKQWDKLIRMNLAIFFERVFVSEDLGVRKGPKFYRRIAKLVKAKGSGCVMIGDREDRDIAPAKNAGWRTVRVRRPGARYCEGRTVADAEISSLAELKEALETPE